MTSQSGVDFTNILRADFMCTIPKSAEKTDNLSVFIELSRSAHVKAVSKMLVKLTPEEIHEVKEFMTTVLKSMTMRVSGVKKLREVIYGLLVTP